MYKKKSIGVITISFGGSSLHKDIANIYFEQKKSWCVIPIHSSYFNNYISYFLESLYTNDCFGKSNIAGALLKQQNEPLFFFCLS